MKNESRTIPLDLETIMPLLIGVWRRFHKLSGPPDVLQTREFRSVVECVNGLLAYSYKEQSLLGRDYFADRDLLGAYLMYQWVLHYQQGMSLIGELPKPPRRVLDICSGPGAFAFAALRHGAREVIATDQNSAALNMGAEVCGRYGLPLAIRQWNCLKGGLAVEGRFDLIIVGYCLEELFPDDRQGAQAFVEKLMKNYLSEDGFLLIVDSSAQKVNDDILTMRDALVAKGTPVQAPCVWRGECPALKVKGSPCYAQRELEKPYLIKQIQRAASINLSSLKMTYLIFRQPKAGWPALPDREMYRVISPPVDAFGGKRFYLCGTDGKKQLGSRLETYPKEARAFEYLKRGELISFKDALEKGNAIDVIEGTTVRVEAPCGKPLPEVQYDQDQAGE